MRQPTVTSFSVCPVAGRDPMALNLSGAHSPWFTRNVVVEDSEGRTGLGEVPGGERITRTLREAGPLVLGARLGDHRRVSREIRQRFDGRDALDTHWIWQEGLERLTVEPPRIVGAEVAVPDAPGLGIRLDRDRLLAAHELCLSKGLSDRDDATGMRYLIEDWTFDSKRPCLVRP
jgi:L-alanine-DL-glutamate epimerase-like enolase superfamily enzyme